MSRRAADGDGSGPRRKSRKARGRKEARRRVKRVRCVGGLRKRNNPKHVGEMAEMQFMLDAARRGFGVAKPFGNNERYDVIVDAPRRLWRVQVKASGARHHKGFAVRACWRTTRKHMPYTSKQIDFLAVCDSGEAATDLVFDSGAGFGRAVDDQSLSVWMPERWGGAV